MLDTVVSITYYSEKDHDSVKGALALCEEYEHIFSRTETDSELYALNESRSLEVSDELLTVIKTALSYCEMSGGKFDITMGGVSALYDFSGPSPHRPDDDSLQAAVSEVGYENIRIDGNRVTLSGSSEIDLGAIAKGYIADRMCGYLKENGVESAIISLGGNIMTVGEKPDGEKFRIGIQYPEKDSEKLIDTVSVTDMSVVTSGIYERFFTENGETYHHILSPETGTPVHNGLAAVSVIGPNSMDCDALSTVCFVMGAEEGANLIESLSGYEALFVSDNGEMRTTSGFDRLHA